MTAGGNQVLSASMYYSSKVSMMKRKSFVVLVFSLLSSAILPGCAQYKWQKYGTTETEFNKDIYECKTEAARTYPTQIVTQQVTGGYMTPSTTNCYGTGSAFGNYGYAYGSSNVNCTTMPGQYVPGYTSTVDVNAANRTEAAKQCMYARGYQLIRVK